MGLNKLLLMQRHAKHGFIRALKRKARRDRLERAARRKTRGRPAGDSLDGLYGQGVVEGSEPTKPCVQTQAPGERSHDFSRSDLGEAAQENALGRPVGRKRSPATRGEIDHPRWDV